jgi:hypothetical protein
MTMSVRTRTIAPLVTAFMDDPVIRWVYPQPGRYLECFPGSSPRVSRHGFKVIGDIQMADSPPMWPMLRRPR